jgi:hypothetical protein
MTSRGIKAPETQKNPVIVFSITLGPVTVKPAVLIPGEV